MKLFKRTFRFTGGEIVGEFLTSTGYLPGARAAAGVDAERGRRLKVRFPTPAWPDRVDFRGVRSTQL